MKIRTMQTNALRGLLYEFGATFAQGRKALFKDVEQALEGLADQLPQMVRDSLREQVARIKAMGADMLTIENRLGLQLKADPHMQRIAQILGVGLVTATAAIAAIATMGEKPGRSNQGASSVPGWAWCPSKRARAEKSGWAASPSGATRM
jgi:transposase